jgi:uncharacterized protein (DUF58 family)
LLGAAFLFAASFPFRWLFPFAQSYLLIVLLLTITDIWILFSGRTRVIAKRTHGPLLFLGEENKIALHVENRYNSQFNFELYDELPHQLQERNFAITGKLKANEELTLEYSIIPNERGVYTWGKLNIHLFSVLGLASRSVSLDGATEIPAYPSIPQMKNFELLAFARISNEHGIKRLRRIGHSYEFEQIKTYVQGDDQRSVNWKATSRRNSLMVNQYQDERSQQVYAVIDKGRSMLMPFNGLSLLDYAINTSLVICNIALRKHDKTGLLTFADKLGTSLRAEKSHSQLRKILQALYAEKEQEAEADFNILYRAVKNMIPGRSLIILFTNFESTYSMERALLHLRKINKLHLLVVVVFENTELVNYSRSQAETIKDIYTQTIAEKLAEEKRAMVQQLRQYGIQVVQSAPEELSLNTVNKYLELKSRGLI